MEKTQHYETWKKVDQHYDWCAFLVREYPCKKKKLVAWCKSKSVFIKWTKCSRRSSLTQSSNDQAVMNKIFIDCSREEIMRIAVFKIRLDNHIFSRTHNYKN